MVRLVAINKIQLNQKTLDNGVFFYTLKGGEEMRVELRNGAINLDGYVNVVNRSSRVLNSPEGKFIEHIVPGAFKRALERANDVELRFNHKPDRMLGSVKQGNLKLKEDSIGLRASCTVNDDEVVKKARNNELRGWSFGFRVTKESRTEGSDEIERRAVEELELLEVSILDQTPAYFATSIEERDSEGRLIEIRCYEGIEVNTEQEDSQYQRNLNLLKLY